MKKLYTLLALVLTLNTFAQAPQGFNYQATVRNSSGALIVNQNVNFKFNIMLNSATSLPVFSETHLAPTDDLGQVNLVIGTGTATTGTFSTINWGTGNYYLGIELNTGSGYVAMGTTQLLSVPYALYANSSGNAQTPTPNLASVLAVNNGANNMQIKNLAEPTTAQDAATKNYVDNASTGNTILADGSIFIGNASNTATAVALSGDVTISNTGVATITNNAVTTSKITDVNVTNAKLDKANIPLSGFGAATADVNLGTKKITNLANPTDIQDAATKLYVDSKIPNGTNVGDNLTWNGTNWVVSSANITAQLPQLTTTTATGITPFAATSGGTITGDGGFSIVSKGVAWSTSPNPTTNDNFTNNGSGATSFQSVLNNLLPGTLYYYRAYATNSIGTGYGISYVFTLGLPTVTTSDVIQTTSTNAVCGGTISDNGGANVTTRGVCWSTNPNPTVDLNTKTIDGNGNGLFSSSISGLIPNTLYYIRAYATNSNGTAYGAQISLNQQQLVNLTIGNQIWSNANLDVTTYRDGTPIPQVSDPTAWANLTTGAWCYYNNNSVNGSTYGKLYNWYAVAGIHDTDTNTPNKILAPSGWHVPSDTEWTTLTDYLGGLDFAGGKMKATGTLLWQSPNTGATNVSGFAALPGGNRSYNNGTFNSIGTNSGFWSSSNNSNFPTAFYRVLYYDYEDVSRYNNYKSNGFSVRCVRD